MPRFTPRRGACYHDGSEEPCPPKNLPRFPYGAVYFRWSNPPREDWERDYRTASEDGVNIFRHWFMWSTIEQAPGKFVWDAWDRQLDLAAKNGIKTICSEWCLAPPGMGLPEVRARAHRVARRQRWATAP